MKNVTRVLFLGLATWLLASCAAEKRLQKCPSTAVLAEASSLTAFTPGTVMAPANELYRLDARAAKTDCNIDKDNNTTDSNLEISFRARRAAGAGAAQYTVPFFVAINNSDGKLVLKKLYSTNIIFRSGQTVVDFMQPVDALRVPVVRGKQAFDYQLLVGLQLGQQQLDYNRKMGRYAP